MGKVTSYSIVQGTGDSSISVMSQKAVTEAVKKVSEDKSTINELAQKFPFNKPSSSSLENKYISQNGDINVGNNEWGVAKYDISKYNGISVVESAARGIAYLYAIYKNGVVVEVGKQLSNDNYTASVDCSQRVTRCMFRAETIPLLSLYGKEFTKILILT